MDSSIFAQITSGLNSSAFLSVPSYKSETGRICSLEIIQQPTRTRMCGFGDTARWPINPPPSARLLVLDEATGEKINAAAVDISGVVVIVDLLDADGTTSTNLVEYSLTDPAVTATSFIGGRLGNASGSPSYDAAAPVPPSKQLGTASADGYAARRVRSNMVGRNISKAIILAEAPEQEIWFFLTDLGIRAAGNYRLQMNVVDVNPVNPVSEDFDGITVTARAVSDVFEVFDPDIPA
ncbi:predicted protein [Uncinocarpus reesii 1704]|uniref:Velvet domain-containing protein n=1 Tax=Uncinocarpus reesii (strain UAMH 1704) TaxID=336963 RepID=C4JSD2_UNCRE|nr:uncharacterized protein UREG_05371 [Uncinocarpus reesii 1704]EEP80529.1 predicted protein [Uncinocarpus reesii 1704]